MQCREFVARTRKRNRFENINEKRGICCYGIDTPEVLMKVICSLPLLFLDLCITSFAGAQVDIKLLISTDISCNWKLDGQPMGLLKAEEVKIIPVSPGEHLIQAATSDGVARTSTKLEVNPRNNAVRLHLNSQSDLQLEIEHAESANGPTGATLAVNSIWTDPGTGLTWTKKDNGSDVDWTEASAYCSSLQLAGYGGWRLPTIEELQGIDDTNIGTQVVFDNGVTYIVHIKGDIKLSGWQWSGSQVSESGKSSKVAWCFHFGNEKPWNSFPLGFKYSMRALCVHRSRE